MCRIDYKTQSRANVSVTDLEPIFSYVHLIQQFSVQSSCLERGILITVDSGLLMEHGVDLNQGKETPASAGHILQWSQWQLLDSILPTGGFAHSFGLEAAVQAYMVSKPEDLKTYVIHVLENTGSLLLPFVYAASKCPNMDTYTRLDKILDATLTNEVSKKASISQGSALLRIAAAVFVELPSLKKMRDTLLGSGTVSFHHAPVFGLICGLLGFDSETSQRAYMFITMRDTISAATRLNLVGPLGASVLQHQIAHIAEELLSKWMNRAVEEACQTAPLLDTVQGCHGYLFSRLFSS
ncbi:PREDICTED: urease accessory protein F isoform X2 [Nelumbo nucifera]|uniref:Urease accessory protein F isoform X2 n=1 Tax=Nelumbo nucifera TaxID=4432 RepID=A0A1U7ZDZ2_NELNU|nr:PREDICTED: urease accessory protein F isoform X2 [Nelumbo nucifera]